MRTPISSIAAVCLACTLFGADGAVAQIGGGGEALNEVPLWPVPQEMTLEEYTDANRRLSVGLALMSVPIPGSLHFYAGERRAGWKHVGAAALGLTSVIAGAILLDEEDGWEDSDYETVDIAGDGGEIQRYARIPVEEEGGVYTYRLKKVHHEISGGGAALVMAGAGLFVGQILHDWVAGIRTIERKRDAVRYKYGKLGGYSLSLRPSTDLRRGRVGAELAVRF